MPLLSDSENRTVLYCNESVFGNTMILFFDELMNKNIMILNINRIHHHQTLIKNKVLMKRENSTDRPCPTPQMMIFSFRKQFDEYMMRIYNVIHQ